MKTTERNIMKEAHKLAKILRQYSNLSYRALLSRALRNIWANIKKLRNDLYAEITEEESDNLIFGV